MSLLYLVPVLLLSLSIWYIFARYRCSSLRIRVAFPDGSQKSLVLHGGAWTERAVTRSISEAHPAADNMEATAWVELATHVHAPVEFRELQHHHLSQKLVICLAHPSASPSPPPCSSLRIESLLDPAEAPRCARTMLEQMRSKGFAVIDLPRGYEDRSDETPCASEECAVLCLTAPVCLLRLESGWPPRRRWRRCFSRTCTPTAPAAVTCERHLRASEFWYCPHSCLHFCLREW